MIGNELDITYGANLDDLFSLINSMALVKNATSFMLPPLTTPLSTSNFETILERYPISNGIPIFFLIICIYYSSVLLDFWSVQVYSIVDMEVSFNAYYQAV